LTSVLLRNSLLKRQGVSVTIRERINNMLPETEKKIYKHETKSMYNLAVCLALGANLVKVDRSDVKFFKFYLESETVDLEEKTLLLTSRKLEINAYDLLEAYSRAKSIVHSR
jgi:hypothetical protein